MGVQTTFHATGGGTDFLGLRKTRTGSTEIVYDNGAQLRMVWRVADGPRDEIVSGALEVAMRGPRVLATLYDELKKRAILFERIGM